MKLWKLGLALSLTAVFGLMACEDSSSAKDDDNGEYKEGTIACKVTTQTAESFVMETRMDSLTIKTSASLENGSMVTLMEYNMEMPKDTCEHYKLDKTTEVVCAEDGKSIEITDKTKLDAAGFEALTGLIASGCKEKNGNPIPKVKKEDVIDAMTCNKDNEGKEQAFDAVPGVSVVCKDSKWVPSKVECETEDESKKVGEFTLVCKDKKWTLKAEEACTDKETKTLKLAIAEVSATCVDGAWQIDVAEATEE